MADPITINVVFVLMCSFRHIHDCIEFSLAANTFQLYNNHCAVANTDVNNDET